MAHCGIDGEEGINTDYLVLGSLITVPGIHMTSNYLTYHFQPQQLLSGKERETSESVSSDNWRI